MTTSTNAKIRGYARNVTCFCCQGEAGSKDDLCFGSNYCASGELDIILKSSCCSEQRTCEVFGLNVSVSSAFTSLADTLRYLCVKNLFVLQNSTEIWKGPFRSGFDDSRCSNDFTQRRAEICTTLNFIKRNVKILLQADGITPNSIQVLQRYLASLKTWALSFGRISDIPAYILNVAVAEHQTNTACHCLFHLKLDFWWFVIVVYHTLDSPNILPSISSNHKICADSQVPLRNHFVGELILMVIWDLVTLSSVKFQKLHVSDYLKVSPFYCSCVKEFWFLLLQLVHHRQQSASDDSLWMYLHYVIRDIVPEYTRSCPEANVGSDDNSLKPDSFNCKKPVDFALWLLWGVSDVWKYDAKGRFIANAKGLSDYFELQKLVSLILSCQDDNRSLDENRLQYCLQICLSLNNHWEPNLDLLITFTDFFLKNLNTCNQSGKSGIEAHCFPKTTGHEWIEQIKDLVSRSGTWAYSDSSFQLLILYIVQQLQNVQSDKLTTSWRKVAGRTFLKLTRPRLNELSESGLHNLLTLLLSLSCLHSSRDICNKIIAMSSMVSGSCTKRALVWRALFALAHNYQQTNEDVGFLTKALADQFTDTLQSFVKTENDFTSRQSLQKLILLYLNEVQNIFDCSPNLALSEHLLIGESFALLLPHCNTSELSTALFTVQQALVQFRNIREKITKNSLELFQETDPKVMEKHQAFVDQLFQFVLPFVEVHAVTQTPPDSVANIAAGLTFLASEGFSSTRMEDVFYFINKFALSVDINPKMASIFLCHVIPENKIVQNLSSTEQIQILGVWLRSMASTLSKNQHTEDLGKLVSKLPEILKLFPSLEISVAQDEENHTVVLIKFFKLHSELFKKTSDVQQKFALANQFQEALRTFVTEVKRLMKGNPSQELMNHLFKLTGNLVYYCSLLIYTMGSSSCLLPAILDTTVLPLTLMKDKVVNQTTLNSCKEHLHLYLFGLVQHNFLTDAYIGRKLKDLVVVYLPRFPVVTGKVCPLLNLQPSEYVTKEKIDEVLLFFTKTVCDSFFSRKYSESNPQAHVLLAVTFVSEVLKQASTLNKIKISTTLFLPLLELLFFVQDRILANHVQDLFCALLAFTSHNNNLRCSLIEKLQMFVEQHLPWQSKQVFCLLEKMASLKNSLVPEFLPSLTRMVEAVEEKRGVGLDKSLRQGLMSVTRRLESNR